MEKQAPVFITAQDARFITLNAREAAYRHGSLAAYRALEQRINDFRNAVMQYHAAERNLKKQPHNSEAHAALEKAEAEASRNGTWAESDLRYGFFEVNRAAGVAMSKIVRVVSGMPNVSIDLGAGGDMSVEQARKIVRDRGSDAVQKYFGVLKRVEEETRPEAAKHNKDKTPDVNIHIGVAISNQMHARRNNLSQQTEVMYEATLEFEKNPNHRGRIRETIHSLANALHLGSHGKSHEKGQRIK
jgi:hypothetical protein